MSWERQVSIKSKDELKLMREAGIINSEALKTRRYSRGLKFRKQVITFPLTTPSEWLASKKAFCLK